MPQGYVGSGRPVTRKPTQGYVGSGYGVTPAGKPVLGKPRGTSAPGGSFSAPPAPDQTDAGSATPWDTDPALISARANSQQQRTSLLLNFGDPELAATYLGSSDPNVQGAAANQYSVLASLRKGFDQNQKTFNEGENQQNLFYSGNRVQGLSTLLGNYNQSKYNAGQTLLGQLSGLTSSDQAAYGTAEQNWVNSHPGWTPPAPKVPKVTTSIPRPPGFGRGPVLG